MTLILTSDPTEIPSYLPTILRDYQAERNDPTVGIAALGSCATSSAQSPDGVLLLYIADPNNLGVANQLNGVYNGVVGAAIRGRVGFSFTGLRALRG